MDAREAQTFDAAVRLLKSRLRHYVYQQRRGEASTWDQMLTLERAILVEAEAGWDTRYSEWDTENAYDRFRLTHLIGMAFHRSQLEVATMFEDVSGDRLCDMLDGYTQQIGYTDLLQRKEPVCNSATS